MSKELIVLGSTGFIGEHTLEVAHKNGYKIKGLVAGTNISKIETQAREFNPQFVALFDEEKAKTLKEKLADTSTTVLGGEEGVLEVAGQKTDIVVNAIVGIAGLKPTLKAIEAGNDIALANKETLVTAGNLVKEKAKENGVKILPVDSEHSAIFQSLQGSPEKSIYKIILTASGGPFFGKTKKELENVSAKEALNHPVWAMGNKITIDSSTLMNKGLEVIEAVHLFDVSADDIEVVVHRQSILHSAVEFTDGAVIGQLGTPDMKLPIQYAITYPERAGAPSKRLSLTEIGTLTFQQPDMDAFPCLKICIDAIKEGGLKPAAVNGANEEAVALFLDNKIKFMDIPRLVKLAADVQKAVSTYTLEDVLKADNEARKLVRENVNKG